MEIIYNFFDLPFKEITKLFFNTPETVIPATDENDNKIEIVVESSISNLRTDNVFRFNAEIQHDDKTVPATIEVILNEKETKGDGKITFSIPEKKKKPS